MNIDRKFLLSALTKAKAVAIYKPTPAMLDVRIGNGTISADYPSLSWHIACPAADSSVIGVNASEAYAFVKAATCAEVCIEDKGEFIQFTCGAKSMQFDKAMSEIEQPATDRLFATAIASDILSDIFKRVTPVASRDKYTGLELACVQVVNESDADSVKFKALDGHKYIEYEIKNQELAEFVSTTGFLIHRESAAMLAKILPDDTLNFVTDRGYLFIQSENSGEVIAVRLESFIFPDTSAFVDKVNKKMTDGEYKCLQFNRKELLALVKSMYKGSKCAVFCKAENMRVEFTNFDLKMIDSLHLLAGVGAPFEFGFNASDLAILLQSFSSKEVSLYINADNSVPCVIEGISDPAMRALFMQMLHQPEE